MKFYFYLSCFCLLILGSCTGSDSPDNEQITVDTISETTVEVDSADMSRTIVNVPSLWKVEVQENQTEKLKKPVDNVTKTMAPQQLVDALNESYPEIHLDLKKISHDTAYILVPKSTYLTQQMGSTGAYNYMATAVYNLTELDHVRYVNFNFEQGDHAEPGTYNREDFKRLR